MYESPQSLKDLCVDFISENVESLIDKDSAIDSTSGPKDVDLFFSNERTFIPEKLSEELLTSMSIKNKLNDSTIGLFDYKHCRLSEIFLPSAKNLSSKGLKKLRHHKITAIKMFELKISVNELIGCLGEWTQNNLKALDVTKSTFQDTHLRYCLIIIPISKLKSLRSLCVRGTDFNNHGLEIVVDDLPCIESIDISQTRISDITLLRKIKHRLKYLAMHNHSIQMKKNQIDTLCQLNELRLLDVSEEKSRTPFDYVGTCVYVNALLEKDGIFPYLTSLDISGIENVDSKIVEKFIQSHPYLQFLGVAHCDICEDKMFTDPQHPQYNPELKVAGTESVPQIILSLQMYSNKETYMQKALFKLFKLTQESYPEGPRTDIIRLVLSAMNKHPRVYAIQMAATACMYTLTKFGLAKKIHPNLLKCVVQSTLNAMSNFPVHLQLQKNALLTLCSDRILQDVEYDKFRCACLVMDCLCSFEDPAMNRMCVAICSILASKIPTSLTSKIGVEHRYMSKLLAIVHRKTLAKSNDMTLKFTLSALWNLTDESAETCAAFIDDGGLTLYQIVLAEFAGKSAVETKVLGLINNIAEVPHLRDNLCQMPFLQILGYLLESEHIDVSYFAAGIISHLACHSCQDSDTMMQKVQLSQLLQKLAKIVLTWNAPDGEMVAYRSFRPFEPLLLCEYSEVKLWAVWAIQHVCVRNPSRYCPMLEEENGGLILREMAIDNQMEPAILDIVKNIIRTLDVEKCLKKYPVAMDVAEQDTFSR